MERNHTVIKDNVIFLSYNSTGFNTQRAELLKDVCSEYDSAKCFLSVQEHWLLHKNKYKIDNLMSSDQVVYSIGAFKDHTQVKAGRGKAGLAQIWHESVDHLVSRVSIPSANRVQAVIVSLSSKILWINSYFPGDPGCDEFDETELRETLSSIKWVLENVEYDNILWCGDINADFGRNSRFCDIVRSFINEHQLKQAWMNFQIDSTFSSPANESTSIIDHFVYNNSLSSSIIDAGVIHRGDNLSGHSPIYLKLSTTELHRKIPIPRQFHPKQCWKKASEADKTDYKQMLNQQLNNISIPDDIHSCNNIHCQSNEHKMSIDAYISDIISAIETSVGDNIPYTRPARGKSSRKVIPGWTELVEPFKQDAKFWYSVWYSAGKPNTGELHRIMCQTRNKFKYAKRRCQNAVEKIKRDKLIQAALNGDCNFFDELSKLKGRRNVHSASKIDNISGEQNIAEHFKGIYRELYNRTGSDQPLRDLRDHVDSKCNIDDIKIVDRVTPCLISNIMNNKLKLGKNDIDADITTDCLKHAPYELSIHISNLFKSCLIHGYIPDNLLLCAIILLVKSPQKSDQDSGNYRGIALSSLFLKIFDWIVLILFDCDLVCDENQFGFESESSTVMCTWAVIEVINYFTSRGTPVYVCLLDYRKAFDLVNHVKMFQNLIDRNVNPVVIRLMITMYLIQRCYIRWGQSRSYSFEVTNGTRQGSVFSPHGGFATYIDPLIYSLRTSGHGCTINGHWYGGFFYADDGLLMTTSIEGLQRMVSICQEHAAANDLMFSTDPIPSKSKTKCMAFPHGASNDLRCVKLNGHNLPWVDRAVHIGNTLHVSGKMNQDLREKRAMFIDRCMELNQEFFTYPPEIKVKMCNIYNTHFTGSPLWHFDSSPFSQLCNSWNVNMRIMFEIPRQTHCWLVEEISGCKHARTLIYGRYIKFVNSLAMNKRPSIRALFKHLAKSVNSFTGSNLRHIMLETGVSISPGISTPHILKSYKVYKAPPQEKWRVSLLQSLLEMRNDHWQVLFDEEECKLLPSEIQEMINDVCI